MEHRTDGLMVDFSGTDLKDTGKRQSGHAVVNNAKQEKEMSSFDQETRLMRAMNEIRECTPSKMSAAQRDLFTIMCENIFRKHGISPESYRKDFGHLGTMDQLHR